MKKYLITIFALVFGFASCYAADCPVGQLCSDIIQDNFNVIINGCTTGTNCRVYLCNSRCECRNTECDSGTTTPVAKCKTSCFQDITWRIAKEFGKQQGAVTLSSDTGCSECPSTVYRCIDGYYLNSIPLLNLALPDGVSSDSTIQCEACPQASDDSNTYFIAPSYVASKTGLANLSDCYIKPNTTITDSVGGYEYETSCPYTK